MVEALTELKRDGEEEGPYTTSDTEFISHPLMAANYASITGQSLALVAAIMHDANVTGIIKMLMLVSYRIGIKVGEQQVMDKFMPKEERGE